MEQKGGIKVLLEDTRNPEGKHRNVHEWARAKGVTIIRTKLLVGDYTLPTDQRVCIDTKAGMQEVYSNVVQQHERFRRELETAAAAGIRLVVLVEEAGINTLSDVEHWKNERRERWFMINAAHKAGKMRNVRIPTLSPLASVQVMNIMQTMEERYGIEWVFCSKQDTGERIWELLNRSTV